MNGIASPPYYNVAVYTVSFATFELENKLIRVFTHYYAIVFRWFFSPRKPTPATHTDTHYTEATKATIKCGT